jgi:capsular exopolysaccharide synthesis family protein
MKKLLNRWWPFGNGAGQAAPATAPDAETAVPTGINEHLVSLLTTASFEAERYLMLRHKVEWMRKTAGLSVVAISSPVVGDGKTTTAINLAGVLAQGPGMKVLVVDGDLRRPSVASSLGLTPSDNGGLLGLMRDDGLTLKDVVRYEPSVRLSVLPTDPTDTNTYELFKSRRFGDLLDEARRQYDYVIVDTPPLVLVSDCRLIAHWVDGVLVVVAAHKTPRKLLEEALGILDPDKVAGLIFNGDDRPLAGYSRYYGYYRYVRSV